MRRIRIPPMIYRPNQKDLKKPPLCKEGYIIGTKKPIQV